MPDHPARARNVFLRVAGEVGVDVHERAGVREVRSNGTSLRARHRRLAISVRSLELACMHRLK